MRQLQLEEPPFEAEGRFGKMGKCRIGKEGSMRGRDKLFVLGVALVAGVGAFMVNFQGTPAMAQGAAAGGLIVVPVQVSANRQMLCLVDTGTGVLCVYDINSTGKTAIELKGARDYTFDVQVRSLHTAPSPKEVEREIEKRNKKANK